MLKDLETDIIVSDMKNEAILISEDRVNDPTATIAGLKIKKGGLCNAKKNMQGCVRGYQCGQYRSSRDPKSTEKFKAITGICVKSSQCLREDKDLRKLGLKMKIKCEAIKMATTVVAAFALMYSM